MTSLRGVQIYWNGEVGSKILQVLIDGTFYPISPDDGNRAIQPNGILQQYVYRNVSEFNEFKGQAVHTRANQITWPYGLVSEFNIQNREPNDPILYNTPSIVSQMVEGLRNISNLVVDTNVIGGANMSEPDVRGFRNNGIFWIPGRDDTSEPLDFNNGQTLLAVGATIDNLNFNACNMGNSNFSQAVVSQNTTNTSFKKIVSDGLNFTGASLLGRVNFNDSVLINAIFDDAIITHNPSGTTITEKRRNCTSFSLLEKYGSKAVSYTHRRCRRRLRCRSRWSPNH